MADSRKQTVFCPMFRAFYTVSPRFATILQGKIVKFKIKTKMWFRIVVFLAELPIYRTDCAAVDYKSNL